MEPASTNNDKPQQTKEPCTSSKFGRNFTQAEVRAWKECKSESFWQRSLPLSTALGVATYYAVNEGYLKKNARFGAAPKVLLAVVAGYFIGKCSYKHKCAEKFMQIPDSEIGKFFRERQSMGFAGERMCFGFGPGKFCNGKGKREEKTTTSPSTDSARPNEELKN